MFYRRNRCGGICCEDCLHIKVVFSNPGRARITGKNSLLAGSGGKVNLMRFRWVKNELIKGTKNRTRWFENHEMLEERIDESLEGGHLSQLSEWNGLDGFSDKGVPTDYELMIDLRGPNGLNSDRPTQKIIWANICQPDSWRASHPAVFIETILPPINHLLLFHSLHRLLNHVRATSLSPTPQQ